MRAMSGHGSLARTALPALVCNLNAPLSAAASTALVGRASLDMVAAMAGAQAWLKVFSAGFQFFAVGVAAKVGALTRGGERTRRRRRQLERVTTLAAAACGCAAAALLAALRAPLMRTLPQANGVRDHANEYFLPAAAALPFRVVAMCAGAAMTSDGQIYAAAALATAQVAVEAGLTYAALSPKPPPFLPAGMAGVGTATAASCALWAGLTLAARLARNASEPPEPGTDADAEQALLPPNDGDGDGDGDGDDDEPPAAPPPLLRASTAADAAAEPSSLATLASFAADGARHFLRTAALQASFLAATLWAASFGPAALAAHQVLLAFWLVTSYACDGIADAVTILGSKIADTHLRKTQFPPLLGRASVHSLALGAALAVAFALAAHPLVRLLVGHIGGDAADVLFGRRSAVSPWSVLVASQPINAFAFLADGALAAAQGWRCGRDVMVSGLLLFAAVLGAYAVLYRAHADATVAAVPPLAASWAGKALMNVWRAVLGMWYAVRWARRDGEYAALPDEPASPAPSPPRPPPPASPVVIGRVGSFSSPSVARRAAAEPAPAEDARRRGAAGLKSVLGASFTDRDGAPLLGRGRG